MLLASSDCFPNQLIKNDEQCLSKFPKAKIVVVVQFISLLKQCKLINTDGKKKEARIGQKAIIHLSLAKVLQMASLKNTSNQKQDMQYKNWKRTRCC